MQSLITAIALRTVKYSDAASIATIWSSQYGRMAVTLPAGNGREARRRRAIMMPMGVFEAVADIKPGRDISRLSDVRPLDAGPIVNPAAGVIAMFLADFLYAVLKDSAPDPTLSDFLFAQAALLKRAKGNALANFHLSFLYRLSIFLGIAPDMGTYAPGRYFDMREARYVSTAPLHTHVLDPERGRMAWLLSRVGDRSLGLLRLNRQQRNEMLDLILDYYNLHHSKVTSIPSLAIVRDIFA